MLFNSWQYAVFLPFVFFVYYGLKDKYRWIFLLAASYFFYMSWNPKLIVLITGTTLVSWLCAIKVEDEPDKSKKKAWLAGGVSVSLLILFFFKYFDFLMDSIVKVLQFMRIPASEVALNLILPVGISFYTFQTLSYVIDVYRGDLKAERHLGYYALYVSFFPQLVAGPIERPGNLLPQLHEKTEFSYDNVTKGMKIMAWGYFKKLVISASTGAYVDKIYNDVHSYPGFALILVTIFFSIQIYCDFSGYSDIAVGTAKMFGKDLMLNFKSPYFSTGIREFWSRWHISLSTWFRDYVYIPLGGNRCSKFRHKVNLMITFLVSGLWHGANWTFVVWGGVHGLMQIIEVTWEEHFGKKSRKASAPGPTTAGSGAAAAESGAAAAENGAMAAGNGATTAGSGSAPLWRERLVYWIRVVVVFLLASFAWLFFRANTMSDAIFIITHMFRNCRYFLLYLREGYDFLGLTKAKLAGVLLPVLLLAVYDYYDRKIDVIDKISSLRPVVRWLIYVAFLSIMIVMVADSYGNVSQQFIYFQF